jgi:hypothetical protein
MKSLEEIQLPAPVTVQIDYRLNQTIQPEAQIRIYSLAEILREHLQRIAGLKTMLNELNTQRTRFQNYSDQKDEYAVMALFLTPFQLHHHKDNHLLFYAYHPKNL